LNGIEIKGMVNTFGERAVGELVALIGSTGNLGIAVVNGNAQQKLGSKVGDKVEVAYQ
jgi:S-adenosylmethionine hydrolase